MLIGGQLEARGGGGLEHAGPETLEERSEALLLGGDPQHVTQPPEHNHLNKIRYGRSNLGME